MSTVKDPSSPMYVPEENREIARERARQHTAKIADYLEVRDKIPTGFNQWDRIREQKKNIMKILGGMESDWNNYKWHIKNAIRDSHTLGRIIPLTDQEIKDIEKTATRYRWQISPYYASLIDPEDRSCPIFMQSVPVIAEYLDEEEMKDPYSVVYNSPAPLITRIYPDRLIINVTNICAMFCRHCLRKKDIALEDMIYPREDIESALAYIAENPEVRDVLITGGDALVLSDETIDWILTELDNIPSMEIKRLGSRMLATLPQRITPELCAILKKHKPMYLNTQFNHPLEVNPESAKAVDQLIEAGVIVGNQSVLLKGINNDKNVMKKLVHELMKIRVQNRNGKLLFRTWAGEVCEYEDEGF